MSKYYTGWQAHYYNARWYVLIERTIAETLLMVDIAALNSIPSRLGRRPRILDVACGTGILLKELLEYVPQADAYGVDASIDMLAQARIILDDPLRVQLERVEVGAGERAGLKYSPQTFDLITCTNALHYISDPASMLLGLGQLLAPGGYLVVEDYLCSDPPFPWAILEWPTKLVGGQRAHEYTLAEVQSLCEHAGLYVIRGKTFTINWLWRGWALCMSVLASETACP